MKTSDLKKALDQKVSSTEWTSDNTWNVLNQVRREKASPKRIRIPAGLTVAAALVILCVGILAGTGKLNLLGHPDQIGGQYTAQPMEVPLAQGGQVTVTEDGTADLVTPEPVPQETAAPAEDQATEAPETETPETETPETEAPAAEIPASEAAAPLDDWMIKVLEQDTPGIAQQLKPLRLYSENGYGQVELVAGLLRGHDAWFISSLLDPEAKVLRTDQTYVDLGIWLVDSDYTDVEGFCFYPNHEEHRTLQYNHMYFNGAVPSADSTLTVEISNPEVETYETVVIPLSVLEQAKETEGVDLPKNTMDRYQNDGETPQLPRKVLDYTQPMEYSLTENVVLTGIGWIDGRLHVQLHHLGDSRIQAGNGTYPAWTVDVTCLVNKTAAGGFCACWDDTGDEQEDWIEYSWKCSPEDLRGITLSASVMQASTPVPGTWIFQVPVSSILDGSGT